MDAFVRKMLKRRAKRNESRIPEYMYVQIREYVDALDENSTIEDLSKFSDLCIQCCINAGANEAQISNMRKIDLKIKSL